MDEWTALNFLFDVDTDLKHEQTTFHIRTSTFRWKRSNPLKANR